MPSLPFQKSKERDYPKSGQLALIPIVVYRDLIKRRFKMIVSGSLNRTTSRWMLVSVLLCALLVLSISIGCEKSDTVTDSAELTGASDPERGDSGRKDGDRGCFELVYPVTFIMPNKSTITVNSDDNEGWAELKAWYEDNPDSKERPSLQYPVQISHEGDRIVTINNDDEMARAKKDCREKDEYGEGIEAYYMKLGISTEMLGRIKGALNDNGIMVNEEVLSGLLKVIYEVKEEGEAFELDPRLQDYLGEIGLTDKQIRYVVGFARRIVGSLNDSGRGGRG
jgi:hypothetical protein